MISRNPITPVSYRPNSVTPAFSISGPPKPVSSRSGRRRRSSSATPAAWRSPEASPATKTTSGTAFCRYSGECRPCSLDLGDDSQGDGQCTPAVLTCHYNRNLPTHCRQEAVELQPERLTFGCCERDAIHIVRNVHRAFRRPARIHLLLEPEELSRSRGEIERQVSAFLEDPDLPDTVARDAARCDVRDCSRRKRHSRVCDVEHRR